MTRKAKKNTEVNRLLQATKDRRLFPNVPDPSGRRSNASRRNNHEGEARPEYAEFAGQRYEVAVDGAITCGKRQLRGTTENISQTGMLVKLPEGTELSGLEGENVTLNFRLEEGDLQEGTEMHYRRMKAKIVRVLAAKNCAAIQFDQPLYEARRRMDRFLFQLATLFLLFCSTVIMLMRAESIRYFARNPWLYGYSIMTAVFLLTRYLFGSFLPSDADRPGLHPERHDRDPLLQRGGVDTRYHPPLRRPGLPGRQAGAHHRRRRLLGQLR